MSKSAVNIAIGENGVATLTLNRPEKHNAFDDAMIAELSAHFTELAETDDVKTVVLASTGKSFSAGADLDWMRRMAEYDRAANLKDAQQLAQMLQLLANLPQPTIARVQGAAYGGAVGLVSCCDIAIADSAASFCLSEVKIGLIQATISPYVIRAIGQRAAQRYFLTAERFSGEEAAAMGLVHQVVDTAAGGNLDDAVQEMAQKLLNNGPLAVRAAKQLIFAVAQAPLSQDTIDDTCHRIADIRVSTEGQEGLSAFLNKRPANWLQD